jgi:CRISPR/Cas system-associated exonuclease Cas4 (RecB family)
MTAQTYEGPPLARDEVAHISGDSRITAGAPISVVLRQIDGRTLGIGQSSVDVLPGKHSLLVDCRIQETESITRHAIEQDFFAGRRYRLVAETGPGVRECTGVYLEASD